MVIVNGCDSIQSKSKQVNLMHVLIVTLDNKLFTVNWDKAMTSWKEQL